MGDCLPGNGNEVRDASRGIPFSTIPEVDFNMVSISGLGGYQESYFEKNSSLKYTYKRISIKFCLLMTEIAMIFMGIS